MKPILFTIIISLFIYPESSKAQNTGATGYGDFLTFVRKGFKPPDAVKKKCEWQYALVEVLTDKSNHVINYTLLNKTSDDLKNSFRFLTGYQFSRQLPINKHPVVFCITIDNEKSNCISSKTRYFPSELLGIFFSDLTPLFKSDPQTIFIPDLIQIAYSFDSVR